MTQAEALPTRWVPPDTFALRLLRARKHLRLSGPKAAALCGIPASTWANWEQGAIPADILTAARHVSDGLGADRNWLLFGAGGEDNGGASRSDWKGVSAGQELCGAAA